MSESSYSSGMNDSFQSVMPGTKPTSQSNSQVTQPGKAPTANNFTKPVSAVPTAAKPVATTSGPAAVSPAPPASPAAPSPTKPPATSTSPFKLNMNMANLGQILSSGVNLGQAVNGAIPKDLMGQAKFYLSNPTNFANTVGAFSPVAEPLMRTAGMPLMMGAYSMLRDPNYLKDLSNGFNFKRGALAAPVAKPAPPSPPAFDQSFDFPPPPGLGTVAPSGPVVAPNAAVRPPIRLQRNIAAEAERSANPHMMTAGESAEKNTHLGLGATGMGAGVAAAKLPGAAGRALGGPVLTTGLDVANVAGLPEAMSGKAAPTWEEIARRHETALSPVDWAKGYGHIANSNSSLPSKALQMGVHTAFGNPLAQIAFNPVSTGITAAQNVREGLNAGNQVNSVALAREQARAEKLRQLMAGVGKQP